MIGPKEPKPSKADEKRAYAAATARDGGVCVRCGAGVYVERDHRKNRSQGGLTVVCNLQCLCRRCHQWKTDHPQDAVLEGCAVPGWAHPETWPAWRDDVDGWVIYFDAPDEDGKWWREISQATADLLMRGDS